MLGLINKPIAGLVRNTLARYLSTYRRVCEARRHDDGRKFEWRADICADVSSKTGEVSIRINASADVDTRGIGKCQFQLRDRRIFHKHA